MAKRSYKDLMHIKSQYPLGDVQRDYLFLAKFHLPVKLRAFAQFASSEFGAELSEDDGINVLTMCVREFPLVGIQNQAIESSFMGMKQFFNGKSEPSTTSVTAQFEEFERFQAGWKEATVNSSSDYPLATGDSLPSPRQIFFAWASLAHDIFSSGVGSLKRDIVARIEVIPLWSDGTEAENIGKYVYHNAWVESIAENQLSYENSGSLKTSVTFKFDYPTIEPVSGTEQKLGSRIYAEYTAQR